MKIIYVLLLLVIPNLLIAQQKWVEEISPQSVDAKTKKSATAEPAVNALSPRAGQTALKNPALPNRWLVAVGISKFVDTRITPLRYAGADARSIDDYFKNDQMPDNHRYLLVDEQATRQKILEAIESIKEKVKDQDTLTIFVSSHGIGDIAGTTYLVAFDSVLDELETTAIAMRALKERIENTGCRNVILLVDSCHSGGAKTLKRPHDASFEQMMRAAGEKRRLAVLTSSRTHEISIESPEWGHGVFTYYVLQGLAGESDNFPRDGLVTVTELFDYLIVAVPRATNRAQHPSGKFSYNWPRDRHKAVPLGRVLQSAPAAGTAESTAGPWSGVLENKASQTE